MRQLYFIIASLFVILSSKLLLAKEIYFGSEVEQVTVAAGGATILRFHEPVKTISQASRFIIKPADDATPDYSVLSITPRFSTGSTAITFILGSGAVINTKMTVMSKQIDGKTDAIYDFKPRDQLIEKNANDTASEMDVMKALIKLDHIAGYSEQAVNQSVRTGVPNLSAKLIHVYTGMKFMGLIFKIENKSTDKDFEIDLESLLLGRPNTALLSQIDRKVLKGSNKTENSTILRIVAKSTAVYSNINLPVTEHKQK